MNNIKMDLREIGWSDMDWIDVTLGYKPVEGSCVHGNETSGFIKYLEFLE
jgi:hypothetical protein